MTSTHLCRTHMPDLSGESLWMFFSVILLLLLVFLPNLQWKKSRLLVLLEAKH